MEATLREMLALGAADRAREQSAATVAQPKRMSSEQSPAARPEPVEGSSALSW